MDTGTVRAQGSSLAGSTSTAARLTTPATSAAVTSSVAHTTSIPARSHSWASRRAAPSSS